MTKPPLSEGIQVVTSKINRDGAVGISHPPCKGGSNSGEDSVVARPKDRESDKDGSQMCNGKAECGAGGGFERSSMRGTVLQMQSSWESVFKSIGKNSRLRHCNSCNKRDMNRE